MSSNHIPDLTSFITTMAIILVHVTILSQLHFCKWLQNRYVRFLFRVLPEPILIQQLESVFKMLYRVTQMLKTLQLNSRPGQKVHNPAVDEAVMTSPSFFLAFLCVLHPAWPPCCTFNSPYTPHSHLRVFLLAFSKTFLSQITLPSLLFNYSAHSTLR